MRRALKVSNLRPTKPGARDSWWDPQTVTQYHSACVELSCFELQRLEPDVRLRTDANRTTPVSVASFCRVLKDQWQQLAQTCTRRWGQSCETSIYFLNRNKVGVACCALPCFVLGPSRSSCSAWVPLHAHRTFCRVAVTGLVLFFCIFIISGHPAVLSALILGLQFVTIRRFPCN